MTLYSGVPGYDSRVLARVRARGNFAQDRRILTIRS